MDLSWCVTLVSLLRLSLLTTGPPLALPSTLPFPTAPSPSAHSPPYLFKFKFVPPALPRRFIYPKNTTADSAAAKATLNSAAASSCRSTPSQSKDLGHVVNRTAGVGCVNMLVVNMGKKKTQATLFLQRLSLPRQQMELRNKTASSITDPEFVSEATSTSKYSASASTSPRPCHDGMKWT